MALSKFGNPSGGVIPLLPQSLVLCSLIPGPGVCSGSQQSRLTVVPHYLSERDYPWIARYYEEFLRFRGKRRREILVFFNGALPFQSPEKKRALLLRLLLAESEDDAGRSSGKKARALRAALFELAARSRIKPTLSALLSAPKIGQEIEKILPDRDIDPIEAAFSDLPMERRLIRIPEGMTPERIALMANLALAQSLVGRSSQVDIAAEGDIRRVVRQAKLRRLICEAFAAPGEREPELRISGPLSLFGHTTVYGRALAELVPLLAWCNQFRLSAVTRIRGRNAVFQLSSSDPFLPCREPRRFDSQVEKNFARDFSALALDWDLVREPEAFPLRGSEGGMIFPDFLIRHRRNPLAQFYLEIVGYWTLDYLVKKIRGLRMAQVPNLILCVDETLACGAVENRSELEKLGSVVFFRKKIRAAAVLAIILRVPTST